MPTVSDLLKTTTEDEALEMILKILVSLDFPATSWETGGLARTTFELLARLYAEGTVTLQSIAKGRYNFEAEGDWLTILSASEYRNARLPATRTIVDIKHEALPGAGPYTIAAQDSVFEDEDGNAYHNDAEDTIPQSGSVIMRYSAEIPGPNPVPTSVNLKTPLAGVESSVVELIQQGTVEERDERLQERNASKWATLSAEGGPGAAYRVWALEAEAAVTRVWVNGQNPGGPGTVWVYIAGDSPLIADEAESVQAYIRGEDGVGRAPLGAHVSVFNAPEFTVHITGMVFYEPEYTDSVEEDVAKAIEVYFRELPIGGHDGRMPIAGLYGAVMRLPGVVNMALSQPAADFAMAPHQVAVVGNLSLTFHQIGSE